MKLFRYIVSILFLFCSVAGKGQEERCDCFWLVFEDTTIQDISVIPEHNYEVYRTNILKSGNKLFARIDVLSRGTDDGNVSTLPYPLLCIDGVPKMYIKCKNLFHSGDINETKVVFKSSGYTVINASIMGGVVKIPYDDMSEGADSVSLINTLMGMAVDIEKRKPMLSIKTGGLSGPAVKPVALRMVWQVAKAVKIPVIGLGGICSAKDAIEFLMVGATAIEIGTANFLDPTISIKVRDGINDWLDAHGCQSVQEIIGAID